MTVKRYGTGLNGRIEEMECGAFTGYAEYSALLKERDALAVESAKAKSVLKQCKEYFIAGIRNEIRPANEGYLHMICDTFDDETPATDAAIASIHAQGLEKYARSLESSADDAERDGYDDAVKFLRSEASGVRLFAAQLRKESNHD